ncbi:MAG: hypothetical protein IJ074_05220 [Clostridia bacterium]|nr:hypothetical protein [Clostridia bacterium]
MTKYPYFIIDYHDRQVIQRIIEKYGINQMDAIRTFISSKTHKLLENAELGLADFPSDAIFDMWEVEKITGDPRNSVYVRGE